MRQPTYDELYGVDLGEYLKFHNKTKEQLLKEIATDIEILQRNYDKYAIRNYELTDEELFLVSKIRNLIEKKRKHYKRIEKWKEAK
jgi:hypothetical protein